MLAENVKNRGFPGFEFQEVEFGLQSFAFESTLPPHRDGAARRASAKDCERRASWLAFHLLHSRLWLGTLVPY